MRKIDNLRAKPKARKSLSSLDKEILQILLAPDGSKVTSRAIAKSSNIPAITVQRRRRKLESDILTMKYGLDLKKFGLHKVHFFVSTRSGKTMEVAKELDKLKPVVYVGRSIGEKTIDLHVQAVLEDNSGILDLLEETKSIVGVQDAIWSEVIDVVSRKQAVPPNIIERL